MNITGDKYMRYFQCNPKNTDPNNKCDALCIIAVEGAFDFIDLSATSIGCFKNPTEVGYYDWLANGNLDSGVPFVRGKK